MRPVSARMPSTVDADVAVDRPEAVEQRLERSAELVRADPDDRRIEQHDHECRDDQRQHAEDDALRHVALGIDRFFRRQRQLLDGQEQPHREGQGREDAREARIGKQRPVAFRQARVPSGAMLRAQRLKSMFGMALIQKITSTASDTSVTMSVTRNDSATPKMLSARKIEIEDDPPDRRVRRSMPKMPLT